MLDGSTLKGLTKDLYKFTMLSLFIYSVLMFPITWLVFETICAVWALGLMVN